ncbi:hypothetical protein E3A20_01990 [Planctomyces bekefii]|uniref:Uncharacterized protein n=1 Tax=Planctomyces bekefii TaxID=1653850 RepID=A0A5C6MC54_9PLAN|nr:hypothetical protein E3A20_01990 [Planctomyces bekefii]
MGRADNRRSPKARRRKAWRRKKLRLQKKIAGVAKKAPAKKK